MIFFPFKLLNKSTSSNNNTNSNLTADELRQLRNLLTKYYTCFHNTSGRTDFTRHHIDTGNTKSIKLRPYRVSPQSQRLMDLILDGLKWLCALASLDNLIVYSPSFPSDLKYLGHVITILNQT
jgi:hypothetical protein